MKKFYLLCALVAVSLTAMAQSRVDSIITQFFDEWVENDSLMSYEMRDLDTVYVYDANNNLISKQTYQFTSLETAPMGWKLIQSDDYIYDTNNHCIEYTRYEWKQGSGWNAPYEWKNTLKHEYTYENGNLKTDIYYSYDTYLEDLYACSKEINIYNTIGQLERTDTYGYNNSTSSWKANPTYRISYTYNEYNLILEELDQEYISSAWTNKSKKNYTYTSNLKLDYAINYKWNATAFSPKFEPDTKLQYSFDLNGNLVNEKWFQYSNGGWDETHNFAYTYNTQNQLITYIHSYSTTSSLGEKNTYEYDADGDLYRMSKFNWDNTYNDWVGYRRYYYYYQGKPSPTYELLIYADFLGENWTYEELEQCWVTGDGRHPYNSTVQCFATCPEGCRFVRWVDGNTDNPRTFTMTTNIVTKAYFEKVEKVNIYVYADPLEGYAEGAGEYLVGENITITAIPNEGYAFLQWNDGNTDNPRQITVTETWTYIAQFTAQADALEDVLMQQNHNGKFIIDGELYIMQNGKIFSPLGTEIKTTQR